MTKRDDDFAAAADQQSEDDRLLRELTRHWAEVQLHTGRLEQDEEDDTQQDGFDREIAMAHTTLQLVKALDGLAETALAMRDRIVPEDMTRAYTCNPKNSDIGRDATIDRSEKPPHP